MSKTYQLALYRRRVGGYARRMALALGGMSITPERLPRARLARDALIINYGMSQTPPWNTRPHFTNYLNHPDAVGISSNKLTAFKAFTAANVPTCEWTTDREVAISWYNKGKAVFARTILCGSRGDGIIISDPSKECVPVPYASLYTCNFNKTHEFRVHVAGGKVIDFVEKKSRTGSESNRQIRNHAAGWVFAHDSLSAVVEDFSAISISAVNALGLDFGGVDILATLEEGPRPRKVTKAIVCEVNSSPAWECTATFAAYQEYFANVHNDRT